MPCPHLSKANGDCLLQQDVGPDSDDGREPAPPDLMPAGDEVSALGRLASAHRDCCLAAGDSYRSCPVLRRFLAELAP